MNTPPQKCVLIVGNDQTCEMRSVLESVREICRGAQIVSCASLEAIPDEEAFPDLILICQNWPDEFGPRTLSDLVSRFPISRFVCCYGVWCEADGRTRTIWPLGIRVPARCVSTRLKLEWEIIRGGRAAFPLTAGRDEIFQLEATDGSLRFDTEGGAPLIQVESGDRTYRKMLEERIVSWEGRIANTMNDEAIDLLMIDLDPWEMIVNQLETRTLVAPIVGVMGLAHPETITAAKLLGIEAVICKVAPEQELFQALNRSLQVKAIPQAEC
ncbi:hypothetical protein Pan241w_25310 [Gimesia alba]|uniref:Uncharacterized protein n=1 Tax=Gimesia alba TaxID=2527973 RepID=A0A517REZ8_9PLAN|nr:hypothetical protein [Gimesia alba]QDT42447.1 hypothetical protein Pan241w_25310 [Gimesia alba]